MLVLVFPLLGGGNAAGALQVEHAIRLVEITGERGVRFVHDPGNLSGRALEGFPLPAIMGAGAALFDANGDGRLDLYLIQAGPLPEHRSVAGVDGLPGNRLYLQQPDGTVRDASEASGLRDSGYGVGVAVGDVDGDGDPDVFVSNLGPDALYLGEAERFTRAAFPETASWSTAAAFCDFDGDSDLDLYVGGYLVPEPGKECVSASGEPDFCSPQSLPYVRDSLYENRGGGNFEDVSIRRGIAALRRPALGVICHDFTGDGRPDFYVANDGEPNVLWEAQPDGTFEDVALLLGTAMNGQGRPEAGMGVVLGDPDGDLDLDLFVTHLRAQTNTLYRNVGAGFVDDTPAAGLALPSLPLTGFGVGFLDIENDGDLDLALVNGAVAMEGGISRTGGLDAYAEPAQVFTGDGAGSFVEVAVNGFTDRPVVGRALVTGDWDRDGDLDLVTTEVGGPARLFENRSVRLGGYLIVKPREEGRPSFGAVVTLETNLGAVVRPLNPEAGYLASNEPIVHFGLPEGAQMTGIRVLWPDGTRTSHPAPLPDTRITLHRPR